MLRKKKHLRYTRQRIRELRYQMVNHCLDRRPINENQLKLYASLLKKYQRKYLWIKM
jgi:hypothetical protein